MTIIDQIQQEIADFEATHGKKPARMWLTRRDKAEVAKLSGKKNGSSRKVVDVGAAVSKLSGVPIGGWESTHRDYQLTDNQAGVTAGTVRARIDDWIERLTKLFDQLEQWACGVPDARVERGDMLQLIEELMTQFKVKAARVPTFTVFIKKNRIAFTPSAIWITGAHGRVNVTTNDRQYALMDLGGKDGKPSRWTLVTASTKSPLASLDRELFLKLLAERA